MGQMRVVQHFVNCPCVTLVLHLLKVSALIPREDVSHACLAAMLVQVVIGELLWSDGPSASCDASREQDSVLCALHFLLMVLVSWALCPLARDDRLTEECRLGARDLPGTAWLLL